MRFAREMAVRRLCHSLVRPTGANVILNGHRITFLFPGVGKHIRQIHSRIIEQINSGQITDIIDIGGAGALTQNLRVGDFVLSTTDISVDRTCALPCKRRRSIRRTIEEVARNRGAAFFEGPILTASNMVLSPRKRALHYLESHCLAVQMEHAWLLQQIQRQVLPAAFNQIFVTHLEIITDSFPKMAVASGLSCLQAFANTVVFNQSFLGSAKTEILHKMLA